MKKFMVLLGVMILGVSLLAGCSKAPPPASSTPAAAENTVTIASFAFSPATLEVKAGTTVTWVNNDSVPHSIDSDTAGVIASGTFAPGKSYTFTFDKAGTYAYHCGLHPTMKATVKVN